MASISEHATVVTNYLTKEMEAGRVVIGGTSQDAGAMGIHCSPFGVIPKRGRPGKWHLMVNLSALDGCSVNDGISKDLASLSYVSVDEVATNGARDPAGKYGQQAYQCIHRTDLCWACNGKGCRGWTWPACPMYL